MLLALNWAKAFDSVNVDPLLCCLQRYGITGAMPEMIAGILQHRELSVSDSGCTSTARPQSSGTPQGCTLSPLLSIITMTVLMHDAVA